MNQLENEFNLSDSNKLVLFDNESLTLVVNGKIDLNKLAAIELSNRGIGRSGKWVGFKQAEIELGV